jgi:prepilin-type N-terminal cleavage/methylation domain-containing protein
MRRKRMRGFSVIEIIVVMVVLGILTAMSLPYLYQFQKLYKTEDQALKLMDLMRESGQLALTHRRAFRFEINLNDNTAKIIDERGAAPDVLLKSIPLEMEKEVRMEFTPTGIVIPNPPNYPAANFGSTRIWSMRFASNGSVVSATDIPISATLILWPPKKVPYDAADLEPRTLKEVRAITIFGGSGAIRYWKHSGTAFTASQ